MSKLSRRQFLQMLPVLGAVITIGQRFKKDINIVHPTPNEVSVGPFHFEPLYKLQAAYNAKVGDMVTIDQDTGMVIPTDNMDDIIGSIYQKNGDGTVQAIMRMFPLYSIYD